VADKQTIFTIAKQYGIQVNDLIRSNPEITKGISVGQVLKIPVNPASAEGNSRQPDVSEYSVHPVVSGETLYSLEQRYGVSHEEMMKFNPALQNGLKTGMKLKIPIKKEAVAEVSVAPVDEKNFSKYKVERGETLFSLASRFGVEVDDIKKANPSLFSRSLESGETILIPKVKSSQGNEKKLITEATPTVQSVAPNEKESTECASGKVDPKQKYKVAFLLPFYLAGNENIALGQLNKAAVLSKLNLEKQIQDSPGDTALFTGVSNIDSRAIGFLEFYEGALLAIDSLQQKGLNVEIFAFDAGNQKMINALLQLDEMRDMNLIVGPVYPEIQETVASFAAKNRIPMISPLAANGSFEQNNAWYFKVTPSREYQAEQTALYIEKELSANNFIVLQYEGKKDSPDAKIVATVKARFKQKGIGSVREYSISQNGLSGIGPLMSTSSENIFLIPTDNEAQVSVAVTNLNTLAESSSVMLLGSQTLTKLKSIQTENFHRIRLRFLSPYFIDYSRPLVKRVVGRYRQVYAAEPTQYSFQGFDVTYYFLSALQQFGKDFRACVPDYKMELTQMIFDFSKIRPMGGFCNNGLFVTSYEQNFDVLNLGTFSNGVFNPKK
jgi:LysM repeat protein/ABC-type branched-subunit amino acid transport system substrate-binding protein